MTNVNFCCEQKLGSQEKECICQGKGDAENLSLELRFHWIICRNTSSRHWMWIWNSEWHYGEYNPKVEIAKAMQVHEIAKLLMGGFWTLLQDFVSLILRIYLQLIK